MDILNSIKMQRNRITTQAQRQRKKEEKKSEQQKRIEKQEAKVYVPVQSPATPSQIDMQEYEDSMEIEKPEAS